MALSGPASREGLKVKAMADYSLVPDDGVMAGDVDFSLLSDRVDFSLPAENGFRPPTAGVAPPQAVGRRSPPYFIQCQATTLTDQYPQLILRSSSLDDSPSPSVSPSSSPPLPGSSPPPSSRGFLDYSAGWAADLRYAGTSSSEPSLYKVLALQTASSDAGYASTSSPSPLHPAPRGQDSNGQQALASVSADYYDDSGLGGLVCDGLDPDLMAGTETSHSTSTVAVIDYSNSDGEYGDDGYNKVITVGDSVVQEEESPILRRFEGCTESSAFPPSYYDDSLLVRSSHLARRRPSDEDAVSISRAVNSSSILEECHEDMSGVLFQHAYEKANLPSSSDFSENAALALNGNVSSSSWTFSGDAGQINGVNPRKMTSSSSAAATAGAPTSTTSAAAPEEVLLLMEKSAAAMLAFNTTIEDSRDEDRSSPRSTATACLAAKSESESQVNGWGFQDDPAVPDQYTELTESSPAIFEMDRWRESPPRKADRQPDPRPQTLFCLPVGGTQDASGELLPEGQGYMSLEVTARETAAEESRARQSKEREGAGAENTSAGGAPGSLPSSSWITGPTSPGGKKRVRISDSTSVRVYEELPDVGEREGERGHGQNVHEKAEREGLKAYTGQARDRTSYGNPRQYGATPTGPTRQYGGRTSRRGGGGGGGSGGLSPRVKRELSFSDGEGGSGDRPGEGTARQSAPPSEAYASEGRNVSGEYFYREYTEKLVTLDQLTFPQEVPLPATEKSLHHHTVIRTEVFTGSPPIADARHRVLVTSDPQGLAPWANVQGKNGTYYYTDQVTGWPLKRSPSLESRDNPFLPGGDLSKEAEDLLRHATIVRDKFYLDQDGRPTPHSPGRAPPGEGGGEVYEGGGEGPARGQPNHRHCSGLEATTAADASQASSTVHNYNSNSSSSSDATLTLEQRISPQHAGKAQASPSRENGRATAGDGVRLQEQATAGGSPARAEGAGLSDSDNAAVDYHQQQPQQQQQDRAKRRPKCCSVM